MNTRSKRASSVGLLLSFVLSPVLPDGTLDVGDRQHTAWTYSGLPPSTSSEGAGASAGSATVTGVGALTAAVDGSSSGTATVSGIGAATAEGVGASAGTATVSGVLVDITTLVAVTADIVIRVLPDEYVIRVKTL